MTEFGETLAPGFRTSYSGELLHDERSPFQHVQIFRHPHFGMTLVLDGLIQTTERDEFCYHEMLVHPALMSLPSVERVLVIGGGDGGTLRRVLEHGPAEAIQCEIDEAVTRVSREHLSSIWDGSLDDPRATLLFDDGAAYVAAHTDAFDAILIDSTDPIGAAEVLIAPAFFEDCRRALKPGGLLVAQTGSPIFQTREMQAAVRNTASVFPIVETYTGLVSTYPGTYWSYTAASDDTRISEVPPGVLRERAAARGIIGRFWTPEVHAAAFALPAFVTEALEQARATDAPVPHR